MTSALVIGGTGFIGRFTVEELLDNGYDVSMISRGTYEFETSEQSVINHILGDRSNRDTLISVVENVQPDIVIDCAAYHPNDVEIAVDIFADVDAYVYVSSGAVYSAQDIPKREDSTPLHNCTRNQATDTSMETYGPRKAECDRIATSAAKHGVAAMSVRPTVVYGPRTIDSGDEPFLSYSQSLIDKNVPSIETHHDYWINRVYNYDRLVVPGDGTAIWHRGYVEDVASALRIVAERGEPGEAYNVADQQVCTLEDVITLISDALGTEIEVINVSKRELAQVGIKPSDYVMYHHPWTEYPQILETCKIASLGWDSTPVETAMNRTVEESLASDRNGSVHDPGRHIEEQLIEKISQGC